MRFQKTKLQVLVFCTEKIHSTKLESFKEIEQKELSEEEMQVWNANAAEAMEAYKKELEEYNTSIAAATDDKHQPQ
ncbi:hypothetical protein Dsin_021485 [Dipteronia sinensis]|uniref:Uncharacterized protein n=1 Tax=Dipteronia sinensis TaxID=43782 RepID=A0AAE0DYV2_9ROSI|nr:hypothetical protein Dsin_021485 [Dipteronia sinensis]